MRWQLSTTSHAESTRDVWPLMNNLISCVNLSASMLGFDQGRNATMMIAQELMVMQYKVNARSTVINIVGDLLCWLTTFYFLLAYPWPLYSAHGFLAVLCRPLPAAACVIFSEPPLRGFPPLSQRQVPIYQIFQTGSMHGQPNTGFDRLKFEF